ncbi:MAG TPA: prolipoprotein diacylglyceryl transferase [bacterium]|jgi:phosphatidylglycerol:prolipoprotein diacylglycerol transferase|nr:prolipoprotein diacylglyceryl transferase [bacterium]
MYPRLLTLGPFHLLGHDLGPIYLYSYGLCMALALGFSTYLFARDAGKYIAPQMKLSYEQGFQKAFDLGVWVIICSILGARVFYVLENHDQFTGAMGWLSAFKIWEGGLVYYGGLFGAIAAGAVWMHREKWSYSFAFDLVAPYISLGQAIGRVGCFLNGCCYGNVDEHYGMVFPGGEDQLPHLPTQLWELGGDLFLFFFLLWIRKRTIRYPWLSFALYGLTYGVLRFVIEFWRRSWDKHYLFIFNSASQAVSGILVVVSLAAIAWIFMGNRKVKPAKRK